MNTATFFLINLISVQAFCQEPPLWQEFDPYDNYSGNTAQLSRKDRLTKLKKLIDPYIVVRPEFQFSWRSSNKIDDLSGKKLTNSVFGTIYRRSFPFGSPKGYWISTDPSDSWEPKKILNVLWLPKNKRRFVDIITAKETIAKYGFSHILSKRLFYDLHSIGISGIVISESWSFIFAPIPDAEIWSSKKYFNFLDRNLHREGESYSLKSLIEAENRLGVFKCGSLLFRSLKLNFTKLLKRNSSEKTE